MNLGVGCYLAGNSCHSVKIMPKGKESHPIPEDDHHLEENSSGVHIFELHFDSYSMGLGLTSLLIILAIFLLGLWIWKKGVCCGLCKKKSRHELPIHLHHLPPTNPYPTSVATFPQWHAAQPQAPRFTELGPAEQPLPLQQQPQQPMTSSAIPQQPSVAPRAIAIATAPPVV